MMEVLTIARRTNLPDWMIGAGFVRNKVWDYLHSYNNEEVQTPDIDLIYFDPNNANYEADKALSEKMAKETGINWEIVNQAYTHGWHGRQPYKNSEEALADWVETPTCVAVSMDATGELKLHAPLGISDLVNLIVRKNKECSDASLYKDRVTAKKWKEKWPKLKILDLK